MKTGHNFPQPMYSPFLVWALWPNVVCVTFYDWSAANSSTYCNCHRKNRHLSPWAWMGVEWTLITWFQFIKEAENIGIRRVREWERGGVNGEQWLRGQGCSVWKKFQTSWLAKCCLVLLLRQPTSLFRRTVYVQTELHAVSVFSHNPPKYNSYYRICNMPTWPFNACICTHTLFAFIDSVRLNGYLFHGEAWGLFFFTREDPLASQTLWPPRPFGLPDPLGSQTHWPPGPFGPPDPLAPRTLWSPRPFGPPDPLVSQTLWPPWPFGLPDPLAPWTLWPPGRFGLLDPLAPRDPLASQTLWAPRPFGLPDTLASQTLWPPGHFGLPDPLAPFEEILEATLMFITAIRFCFTFKRKICIHVRIMMQIVR